MKVRSIVKVKDLHEQCRALPTGTLEEVVGSATCLVLAPHPYDESLGCGGLIAACCAAGRPQVVAILTDSSGSHPGSRAYPPQRLAAIRKQEVTAAIGHLGMSAERLILLGATDGRREPGPLSSASRVISPRGSRRSTAAPLRALAPRSARRSWSRRADRRGGGAFHQGPSARLSRLGMDLACR